jgi:tetratricopeptide (TPR) repeat protein
MRAGIAIACCAAAVLTACSSAPPAKETNAMVQTAQTIERRAGQAFAKGEFDAAAGGYESAALVYETLALLEPQARARLNQARALADAGQPQLALPLVESVLSNAGGTGALSADLRATAHGRAAALLMDDDLARAQTHVQDAMTACASSCGQLSALTVLRARTQLAANQTEAAVATASAALTAAKNDNDRANALRLRAQAQAVLGQHNAVLTDAQQALALDQNLGSAQRVALDLLLLQNASLALGDTAGAARYTALAERAKLATAALRRERSAP